MRRMTLALASCSALLLSAVALIAAPEDGPEHRGDPAGERQEGDQGPRREDGDRGPRGEGGDRGPEGRRGPEPRGWERRGPEGEGGQRRPPAPPLMRALDADRDGEISSTEMEGAAAALKSLDKNGDGKVAREEIRPEGGPPRGFGPGRGPEGQGHGADGPPRGERRAWDRGGPGGEEGGRGDARRGGRRPEGGPPEGGRGEGRRDEGPGDRGGEPREWRRPGPGGPGGFDFGRRFESLDANQDGKISKDEASARMNEHFGRLDQNSDDSIDRSELDAMRDRFREGRGRPEGRRDGGTEARDHAHDEQGNQAKPADAKPEEVKSEDK